jgi:hypothetical protein
MLNGDLTIEQNPTISLNQNINTVSVLGGSTLTLKSQEDVVLNPNISIQSSGGKLNTILWADSDGNEAGGVLLNPNATIATNGGHLWIGGGAGSATWNDLNVGNSFAAFLNTAATLTPAITERYAGINILGSTINAGGGDIYMSGKSAQTDYRFGIGVRFNAPSGTSNTITANNINIYGIGSANANTEGDTNRGNWGVGIENTTINATGDIYINGQGGGQSAGSNGGQNHGIRMDANSALNASGTGNITLIGQGGGNSSTAANTDNDGLRLDGGTITTVDGDILLDGVAGLHGNSEGISQATTISSTNGDISYVTDSLAISGTSSSTGNLIIKPKTSGETIGIGGATGTLALDSSYFNTNFTNGFSNIIVGSEDSGDITIGGTTTYQDNLTFKTKGNIFTDASTSLTSNGANSLVFWADADASGSGSIYLKDGSSITTNGGDLWMGGSSTDNGTNTWNGLTVGNGYAMAGTAHSVTLGSALNYQNGISFSNANISTSGGNVALYGKSKDQTAASSQGYIGILFDKSTISSGDGNIDISAITQSTSTNASWNYGLLMATYQNNLTSSISSTGGIITITGETSFQKNTHGAGIGLYGWNNTNSLVEIRSTSGNINLTGRVNSTGFDGQYGGIFLFGSSQENIVSQTGDIALNGFSANPNVFGINVASGNDSAKIGYDGTNAYSGDITFNSDTKINFEGSVVADTLNLLGNGVNYTLQSTQNDVNTLTANTGKVTFVNKNDLTLGAITATDTIDIATLTDNLTINGNIATSSTEDDAITLNAGKNTAAGTSTGGNIVHTSGTISTGANGRATLYSGSYTSGNSFDSLVSNNDYRKFNSDETTVFDPTLGSGIYLIYRGEATQTPEPTTQNEQQSEQTKQAQKVVDTILTNVSRTPPIQNVKVQPKVQSSFVSPQNGTQTSMNNTIKTMLPQINESNANFTLVSKTNGETVVSRVSMQELQDA